MKLYYSPASPFARKVLMTAAEVGVLDRIEVVAATVLPTAPNATVAALNPLMQVPTLELDDGSSLYDSKVICEYLDWEFNGHVFPREGARRWNALRTNALADGIMNAALLIRYEVTARPEALRWGAWIDGQRRKIAQGLDQFDAHPPAGGDALDIGGIAVACALGYLGFRFADDRWLDGRPRLKAWFDAIAQRESFVQTVPR